VLIIVLLSVAAVVAIRMRGPGSKQSAKEVKLTGSIKERYRGISRPASDAALGRELIPNAGNGVQVVNDLGYVGKRYAKEKAPNAYRLLGLGNANSMYYGAEEQNYLSLLERSLAASKPGSTVEVLDFAIDGETLPSAVRRFEVSGLGYKPDLLIVGYSPDQIVDLKAALEEIAKKPISDPSGPEGLAATAELYKFLSTSREVKQAFYDRIFASDSWRNAVMALNNLERLAKSANVSVVVVALPLMSSFEPYQFQPLHDAIRVQAERHGFRYLDLSPEFAKFREFAEYREADDVLNYSPTGHAAVAEALQKFLTTEVAAQK
jgi:lysophospholipase L1-like esterase